MRKMISVSVIAGLAFAVSGCATATKSLGLTKRAPNEFNILTKAPLIVPPEYNLRPPKVGESSAENNYSQEAARKALLGDVDPAEPSRGEIFLLTKAGVGQADQEIRVKIDGQNSVERKSSGLTDRILFWNNGKVLDATGAPLDPESEARRLKAINSATGGEAVQITRRPGGAKLPGL